MIREEPTNVALRNDVAVVYTEMGRSDQAVRHLEMVVQLQPDSATTHYNLGTVLSSMGNAARAVEEYQQALELRPGYALAHNNLGHALLAMATTDDADRHFHEAVRLDPQNAGAHYNIGMIARAGRPARSHRAVPDSRSHATRLGSSGGATGVDTGDDPLRAVARCRPGYSISGPCRRPDRPS
jgi:Flp pilus assembly protein TadD